MAAGPLLAVCALALAGWLASGAALAQQPGFKFSQQDDADRQEQEARQNRIAAQLSTPCRASIKDKKIVVLIGERRSNGIIAAEQQNYGPLFDAINNRLRNLGLRTYTPEEIRRQIAQAEIDAYFRNDQDAMLSAAKRLGASFALKGLITADATRNPMMNVNQVIVNMHFTLTGRREDRVGGRRALGLVRRRGCLADGAHARQRAGRRGGRDAVFRLLPDRGRRAPQAGAAVGRSLLALSTMHSEDHAMSQRARTATLQILLGAALVAAATTASAQPTWGNPSPTAGGDTSQKANAAADQTIYQAVTYTNASKKGPALVVIPRRDQEQQCDVPAEVHREQHRGLRRDRAFERQLHRARALEPGPALQGVRARLQPGRSGPGAQVPEDGQAQGRRNTWSSSTS